MLVYDHKNAENDLCADIMDLFDIEIAEGEELSDEQCVYNFLKERILELRAELSQDQQPRAAVGIRASVMPAVNHSSIPAPAHRY